MAEGVGVVPKIAIFCVILARLALIHRANTDSRPALLRASILLTVLLTVSVRAAAMRINTFVKTAGSKRESELVFFKLVSTQKLPHFRRYTS
jgi:hypothetical protein